MPGLRSHIVYRQDGSRATFARYAWSTVGAIYGPAIGHWRPPAKGPIEGLVLAGASVFPGAGIEAVVISGTLAADAICQPRAATADAVRQHVIAARPYEIRRSLLRDYLPRRCAVERYALGGTERSARCSFPSRAVPSVIALAIVRNVALDSSMTSPA